MRYIIMRLYGLACPRCGNESEIDFRPVKIRSHVQHDFFLSILPTVGILLIPLINGSLDASDLLSSHLLPRFPAAPRTQVIVSFIDFHILYTGCYAVSLKITALTIRALVCIGYFTFNSFAQRQ